MRSPLVADVWRRARYARAARAGCRLPRRLNSDRSTPYSSRTTSLNGTQRKDAQRNGDSPSTGVEGVRGSKGSDLVSSLFDLLL